MTDASGRLDPWFKILSQRDRTITAAERTALEGVISHTADVEEGKDLVLTHDRPSRSTLILEGWAARYIDLTDGRRQIVALHLPGDFVDLHSFPLHRMDHSVLTLTPCTVAYAPHEGLRALTETQPHLTRLLWLSTLVDGAILRQWLLSSGQRSALERLANLICELQVRLTIIGQTNGAEFSVYLTQSELGQVLGITAIHVNRTIQELRNSGVISWRGTTVTVHDQERLRAIAEFDPIYLHLESEHR